MPFEVLNALRYAKEDIKAETLEAIVESLCMYNIETYALEGKYAQIVMRIAIENDIIVYDASYVALAKHLNALLYTADEELVSKLREDYKKYTRHLGEYTRTNKKRLIKP